MYVDSHTHLQPHHVNPPPAMTLERIRQYVDAARANGVDKVAITEHVFRFHEPFKLLHGWWDDDPNPALAATAAAYWEDHVSADLADYVRLVQQAKSQGLPLLLGIEMDWLPGREDDIRRLLAPYDWDVVLGSVHWIGAWSIDSGSSEVDIAEWDRRDIDGVYETYVGMLRDAAQTGMYDVLAHPDLPKIFGHRPKHLGPFHAAVVEAAKGGPCAIELNSNGFNKPIGEAYPDPPVIEGALAAGLPITFASDAHTPDRVGERFDDLAALATAAGYEEFSWFEGRSQKHAALPAGRTA